MMKLHAKVLVAFALLSVGCILAMSGCETASTDTKVVITPSSATVVALGSVLLTASGGYDYFWSLTDESLGVLSERTGEKTRYTSLYDPGADVKMQIVKVISTVDNVSPSSSYEVTAEAYISHISTEQLVYITPSTITMKVGNQITFSAVGGSGYLWSLQDSSYGTLSRTNSSSTVYTSILSPDENQVFLQVLTVRAVNGGTATALITHEWQYN